MWLQQYRLIEFADDGLESQADVAALFMPGANDPRLYASAAKILTGSAQPAIQFSFGDSARQVLTVHKKLPKS